MKRVVLLLGLLSLVRSLLYTLVVPPWESPDAPGHFELVALIAELGHVPTVTDNLPALTLEINASTQVHHLEETHRKLDIGWLSNQDPPLLLPPREAGYQKPLYYILLAPLYSALRQQDILIRYYALVLASSLMSMGTVLVAAALAGVLFPGDELLQVTIPALVLFWPMQSFSAASISNDNLATLVAALSMLGLARLFRYGVTRSTALVLLAGLGLGVLAKRTTYFLVPLIGLGLAGFFALMALRRLSRRWRWAPALTQVGMVIGLSVVVLMVLNSRATSNLLVWLADHLLGAQGGDLKNVVIRYSLLIGQVSPSLLANPVFSRAITITLITTWAMAGWGIPWPTLGSEVVAGLAFLALLGLILVIWHGSAGTSRLATWQKMTLGVFALAFPLAFLPIILEFSALGTNRPGRLLQTLLLPMATLAILGLRQLCPKRVYPLFAYALIGSLFLCDAVSLALTAIPGLYSAGLLWGG